MGTSLAALGIDVGSTNTKAVLVTLGDAATTSLIRSAPTPEDAGELVRTVFTLVRQVVAAAGVAPQVVGIASMAETGVPLGAEGEPLTGLLRWNAVRDPTEADALFDRLGRTELFVATGVQPGRKAPLAMWAWLKQARPDAWGAMARWAGVSALTAEALTGEFATDHTLAGRTMAYRLPPAGQRLDDRFDAGLLAEVGLRPEQLPRVVPPGQATGRVTRAAADLTGLTAGTPVVIAGHDHAVGSWAAGVRNPGDVADSVGTAEALVRILATEADRAAVLASGMGLTRSATGEHESLIAGSASAGSLVRWWFETYFDASSPEDALAGLTLTAPPTGLLVLPYLIGRQTPAPDPAARVAVLDANGAPVDPATVPPADRAKAVFEGLALQLRWMDAEQRRLDRSPASGALTVLGGPGAADPNWLGIKAAVLGVPLRPVTEREPVGTGAALLAAERLGIGAPGILPASAPVAAGPFSGDYDHLYAAFVAAATRRP